MAAVKHLFSARVFANGGATQLNTSHWKLPIRIIFLHTFNVLYTQCCSNCVLLLYHSNALCTHVSTNANIRANGKRRWNLGLYINKQYLTMENDKWSNRKVRCYIAYFNKHRPKNGGDNDRFCCCCHCRISLCSLHKQNFNVKLANSECAMEHNDRTNEWMN